MATFYIDPSLDTNGSGSFASPFNSPDSIVWSPGYRYLFNNSSVCRRQIIVGADDVYIGTYGDGPGAVVSGSVGFVANWSQATNGEIQCSAPANTFGASTTLAMLLRDGAPITKRGSPGSLLPGEWQASGANIVYRPLNVSDVPTFLEVAWTDSAIRQTSAAVRNNVHIDGISLEKVHIGIFSANDGGTEAANFWRIEDVRTKWNSRSAMHIIRGNRIDVVGGRFEKYGSTGLNFGLVGGVQCNNVSLYGATVDDGVPWITDTNLEGHAIDMVEGCSGLSIKKCVIRNHGANYPGSFLADVSGATHRPDSTVSFDGVIGVVCCGNEFVNNALAPVQCGDFVDGSVVQGLDQTVAGNVFRGNLKKFTTVQSSAQTLLACVQVMGATYERVRISNNFFADNGNGVRLTGESQRPSVVYAVATKAGAKLGLEVKNNIFGANDVSTLLTVRNLSATGTVGTSDIANNVYGVQTAPQWSNASVVTQRVWVQSSNVSYRVPFSTTWAIYQAAGFDSGAQYDVDLSGIVSYSGELIVPSTATESSLATDNPLALAGTYVQGVHLQNGRMRPGFCPVGAYQAVLPKAIRT